MMVSRLRAGGGSWGLTKVVQVFTIFNMAYRHEQLEKMANAVLPLQRQIEPYVTVRQAAEMWNLSTTAAYNVLQVMLYRNMARKVGKRHYHIVEVTK